ncbi:unannotated protein [freshwater metagenome]|uniref:Unannotated protein n=1 Tax=freshwater metagenome TaxID=449393 RepID=A0A6J6SR45_9ZZZZ
MLWVHRGVPEFISIHFTKALVTLDGFVLWQPPAGSEARLDDDVALAVGVGELGLLA